MKGLILKDLLILRQQAKIYCAIALMWAVIAVLNKDSGFFSGLVCVFANMLPISALGYDERAKWDKYGLTMPVSRKSMVISKYILGMGCAVFGVVMALVFNACTGNMNTEAIVTLGIIFTLSLFFFSIVFPILLKFGVEKGRILMIAVFAIPMLIGIIASKVNFPMPSQAFIDSIVFLIPIAIVALLLMSIAISISIYQRKEF